MGLTHYCPSCWNEVGTVTSCPSCGADLRDFSGKSYEEKLILALRHPEPTVPIRAAMVLGELASQEAVNPLVDLAGGSPDPYIQEAAVEALGRIGDPRALACLNYLSHEGAVRVRAAAGCAVKSIKERRHGTKGQKDEKADYHRHRTG